MGDEIKGSYRLNIYFSEEEKELINEFNNTISKDWRIKRLCKKSKNQRFSPAIKMLMKAYIGKTKKEGVPPEPEQNE